MSQGTGLWTGHSGFSKYDSAELKLPGNEVERANLGSQGLFSLKKDQKQAVTIEADGKAQRLECQHGH